jgi:hypothetical protein
MKGPSTIEILKPGVSGSKGHLANASLDPRNSKLGLQLGEVRQGSGQRQPGSPMDPVGSGSIDTTLD